MFQSFTSTASPEQGPPRLAAFRAALAGDGLDGFIVPRADAFQGEYVAAHDDRLAWLTGFTGSAGFAIVLPQVAGVFVDGRYRLQARAQCDPGAYTPVDWPETRPAAWLKEHAGDDAQIGFDPWLHTVQEIEALRAGLAGSGITLVESPTPVDRLWSDQPAPPMAPATAYPETLAGESADAKRRALAATLAEAGETAAVLTQPDGICWLLNIRGGDIPRVPVAHGFAILHADASVDLFMAPAKLAGLGNHLGANVRIHEPGGFGPALSALDGRVRIDKASVPVAVHAALVAAGAEIAFGREPCLLPKACKSPVEIAAAREAHARDAAAVVEFLAWLEKASDAVGVTGPELTEIDVVKKLEEFRSATGKLKDISFDTICGAGPNGAIMHYRVTEETNRKLAPGELLLVDSGGQYLDGTTDITRTMAVGSAGTEERTCYTRVLRGLIAISVARFPEGVAGRDLDALARMPLWQAGQDFNHGTGHGVGQYLSVHEGPQRISRISTEVLKPGMILSNEPGYYRDGAFGIRLENLIVVREAAQLKGGDAERHMLDFETLTYVPFDRRMILADMLTPAERAWLNAYHAETCDRLAPLVSRGAAAWLERVTAPI
ncbi:aminopeptidase P family protein [Poseidonocella sp. HB161398]|uniref:aminopeptidase P family protein n=1 Tax=Poseidonocella sp. HB161398 TaxID=2320855 RepID=UPI001108E61C|nr:aminopeptidase P family protein [Poseidonocella sp. HB161398]